MSEHTHKVLVDGCYRCDLNRDEIGHPSWTTHMVHPDCGVHEAHKISDCRLWNPRPELSESEQTPTPDEPASAVTPKP